MAGQTAGARSKRLAWKTANAFALIFIADFLFYGHNIGWTVGLFALLLITSYLVYHAKHLKRGSFLPLGLCIGLVFALLNNPSLLALLLFWASFLLVIVSTRIQGLRDLGRWFNPMLKLMFLPIGHVIRSAKALARAHKANTDQEKKQSALQSWALPVLLSGLFITLFAAANPIISNWVSGVFTDDIPTLIAPLRWMFWLVVLCFAWLFIRPRLRIKRKTGIARSRTAPRANQFLNPKSVFISLTLFNLIFLSQTFLDLYYLWGGAKLPAGLTYAQYAHDGAYTLIFTAILAAIFVLTALRPGSETERHPTIHTLVILWIAQNILLVISSIWRTTLYVEEYSLTYLRLAALVWMGLVALGLCLIIIRISLKRDNHWLLLTNGSAAFCVLYLCCFINFDNIIARYNVSHSYEITGQGNNLDVRYLRQIGQAALPAIDDFIRQGGTFSPPLHNHNRIIIDLRTEFTARIERKWSDWRGRTYQLYRLKAYLDNQE